MKFAIGAIATGIATFIFLAFSIAVYHANEDMQQWDRWNDNDDRQMR